MEVIQPKNLNQILAGMTAACDCVCGADQYAGAQGAGKNGSICGCYCAVGNDSANDTKADNKKPTGLEVEVA